MKPPPLIYAEIISMQIDSNILTKKFIQRAKRDPEAFGRLFDTYYRPIFGYILRRTANIELTQDLTSETFFKALKNLRQFEWRGENSFSSWLYKIATNEINMHFRKNKNIFSLNPENSKLLEKIPASEKSLPDSEIIAAQEELNQRQEFLKIHRELKKLKNEYQAVITLKYFEKKKIEQISRILDKPEGTIKSWIHRGLKELRKSLQTNETF